MAECDRLGRLVLVELIDSTADLRPSRRIAKAGSERILMLLTAVAKEVEALFLPRTPVSTPFWYLERPVWYLEIRVSWDTKLVS